MFDQTVAELSRALHQREISSAELTRAFLDRIAKLDGQLNSFITVDEEAAMTAAARADERLAGEAAPALAGIPIAHKDIFCTRGTRTSCGSRMLTRLAIP